MQEEAISQWKVIRGVRKDRKDTKAMLLLAFVSSRVHYILLGDGEYLLVTLRSLVADGALARCG